VGRWLQPDPLGLEGGLNLYEYCGNDPINYVDITGAWPQWLESEMDTWGAGFRNAGDTWAAFKSGADDGYTGWSNGFLNAMSFGLITDYSDPDNPKQRFGSLTGAIQAAILQYLISQGLQKGCFHNSCFTGDTAVCTDDGPHAIEDISPGTGVVTEKEGQNSQIDQLAYDREEFDAKTWRIVKLLQQQADGGKYQIELLRPEWWLAKEGIAPNSVVTLLMPEIGANGTFHVLSVEPILTDALSQLANGSHRVIGRFVHHNAEVRDLTFEGESEPLGVTATHPIWSVTRNAWIAAGDFKIGEEAQTATGTAKLLSIVPRPGRHTVYNLEVHQVHTFRVGNSGVLVHNACGKGDFWKNLNPFKGKTKTSGSGSGKRFYEWDHTHGDIEVYNNRGNHLGSMDPITGNIYKPPVPGRNIKV
jgi:hypothetical protein